MGNDNDKTSDHGLFRQAVAGARRLRQDKISPQPARRKPVPEQSRRETRAVLADSLFDPYADSEIETLEQLRGRVFAFADPLCSPGGAGLPWEKGRQPETFFKKHLVIYSHDRTIKAVVENLVDGAVVDGVVYEQVALSHPEEIAKTRILWRSASFGTPPVAVHPRMNLRLKRELQGTFLTMHQDEEGRKILQKLAVDRFLPPDGGIDAPAGRKAGGGR